MLQPLWPQQVTLEVSAVRASVTRFGLSKQLHAGRHAWMFQEDQMRVHHLDVVPGCCVNLLTV